MGIFSGLVAAETSRAPVLRRLSPTARNADSIEPTRINSGLIGDSIRVCRRNDYLRARTATYSSRSIVPAQHIVCKILSPTHSYLFPMINPETSQNKIAVAAPMPRAIVKIATAAKHRDLASCLKSSMRTSCSDICPECCLLITYGLVKSYAASSSGSAPNQEPE